MAFIAAVSHIILAAMAALGIRWVIGYVKSILTAWLLIRVIEPFPWPPMINPFKHGFMGTINYYHNWKFGLKDYKGTERQGLLRRWLGDRAFIMIMDADGLKDMLESEDGFLIQKPPEYEVFNPLLDGARPFVISNGHEWVNERKYWLKTLPLTGSDQLIHRSNVGAQQVVTYIRNQGDTVFDWKAAAKKLAFVFSLNAVIGLDMELNHPDVRRCFHSFEETFARFPLYVPFMYLRMGWLPIIRPLQKMGEAVAPLKKFFKKQIKAAKAGEHDHIDMAASLGAMLTKMEETGHRGTDDQTAIGLFAQIGALHTLGASLSMVVYVLGCHPEAQEKARAEVDKLLSLKAELSNPPSASAPYITQEMVHQMTYLRCCIKEAFRLFPIAPFIIRQVNLQSNPEAMDAKEALPEPRKFTLKGFPIPDKTLLLCNIYAIQRNPKHWERPDDFVPERFAAENAANNHPYAYCPFLAGKRICPGVERAYTYVTIVMAALLANFNWISEGKMDNLTFKAGVLIEPQEPLNIQFIPRHAP